MKKFNGKHSITCEIQWKNMEKVNWRGKLTCSPWSNPECPPSDGSLWRRVGSYTLGQTGQTCAAHPRIPESAASSSQRQVDGWSFWTRLQKRSRISSSRMALRKCKYHICRNKRPGRLTFKSNEKQFKIHWFCVLPPLKNHCFWWAFISVNTVRIIPSYTTHSIAYEENGKLTRSSSVVISSMETHRSEMWTLQFLKDSDRDFENADRRQSLRRMMVRFGEAPVIIRDRSRKFLPVSGWGWLTDRCWNTPAMRQSCWCSPRWSNAISKSKIYWRNSLNTIPSINQSTDQSINQPINPSNTTCTTNLTFWVPCPTKRVLITSSGCAAQVAVIPARPPQKK